MKLSGEELDKIACWIDLLVPYCGDYAEANTWDDKLRRKYQRSLERRREMEAIEEAGSTASPRRPHAPATSAYRAAGAAQPAVTR